MIVFVAISLSFSYQNFTQNCLTTAISTLSHTMVLIFMEAQFILLFRRSFGICCCLERTWDRHSSVGTATRYGLGGPWFEPRWSRDFPDPCIPIPWPTQPLVQYNWYRISLPGVQRLGRGAELPHFSSAEVKEKVQLCLCLPSLPAWHAKSHLMYLYKVMVTHEYKHVVVRIGVCEIKTAWDFRFSGRWPWRILFLVCDAV